MCDQTTVLAIDDNPVNLEVIREALQAQYQLVTAENGVDGLLIAKEFKPAVVLLDVMMPGLDGYEVCRRIKHSLGLTEARVIMVSARVELRDKLAGYESGADCYITKPFSEEELLSKVAFAARSRELELKCGAIGDVLSLIAGIREVGAIDYLAQRRAFSHLLAERHLDESSTADLDRRQFLDDLYYACALKDVGLLAMPSHLLGVDNAYELRQHESEVMKEHTLIGASLMGRMARQHPDLTFFSVAELVARSHHENFNGSGYPLGLAGDEIPIAARILRAIDRLESVLEEIQDGRSGAFALVSDKLCSDSGTLLDPTLTNWLIEILAELSCGTLARAVTVTSDYPEPVR